MPTDRDDTGQRRRYLESADVRDRRGAAARDTHRLDVPSEPVDDVTTDDSGPHLTPPPLDVPPEMQGAVSALWMHVASVERRISNVILDVNQTASRGAGPEVAKRLDDHDQQLALIHGVDGSNGKIGRLSGAMSTIRKVVAAVGLAALGAIGAGITAVRSSGERDGATETRLGQLEHQVDRLTDQLQALWAAQSSRPAPTTAPTTGATP